MKAVLLFLCALSAFSPAVASSQVPGDIQEHPTCKYCDMNRQHYSYSRMLIKYNDNSSFGACSLHCAALNLAVTFDKLTISIEVADFETHELIDAESAFWVIGGSRPGVMTQRAKWAFRTKKGAELFMKWNGGALVTFDEALKAAYKEMYEDSRMIRGKRKLRNMLKDSKF